MESRTRQQHPSGGESRWRKRRLWSGVSFMGVVGSNRGRLILCLLALACRASAQTPALQVEVYDYGRLKPATLHELVTRMQGILAGAGLSVHVEACASGVEESCKTPPGTARSLVIRVVTGTARKMRNVPRAPLGLSFANREGGTFASVFLERIQDEAAKADFSWVIVLAYTASHEVGHLLLGNQAHTPQGLMKAYWDHHDYLQMSQNRCHFSDEQVQELTKRYGSSGQADTATGAEFKSYR